MEPRRLFEAIGYVLRTGCQWKVLPKEYGSASSAHAYFLKWKRCGGFGKLWRRGLAVYDDLEGIAWSWQSIGGAMVKAPLAREAVGRNPTDRGRMGTRRSLLADGRGVPLSLVVSGAQRHDVKLLGPTLVARVIRRPRTAVQHLCADKGYAGRPAARAMKRYHHVPHVRQRGEEIRAAKDGHRHPARRRVVERTHSWLNRFR